MNHSLSAAEVERKVIASTLDVVVHDFSLRAATFFTADEDSVLHLVDARAPDRSPGRLAPEVKDWVAALHDIDPLALPRLGPGTAPVATLADVGGSDNVIRRPSLSATYERIGAVNEARMLIRDEDRVVAGVTLWRALDSAAWGTRVGERLAALQPLVEVAYRKARVGADRSEQDVLARMTRRQREVIALLRRGAANREIARALGISESTARSHTRAALAALGVSSRREVAMRLSHD